MPIRQNNKRACQTSGLPRYKIRKIEKDWKRGQRIDRTILQIWRSVSSSHADNLRRDFAGRFGRTAPDGERGQPGHVHAVRHHVVRPGLLRRQRDARSVHEGIEVRAVDRTDRVADGLKRTSTGPVRGNPVVRRFTPIVFIYVLRQLHMPFSDGKKINTTKTAFHCLLCTTLRPTRVRRTIAPYVLYTKDCRK